MSKRSKRQAGRAVRAAARALLAAGADRRSRDGAAGRTIATRFARRRSSRRGCRRPTRTFRAALRQRLVAVATVQAPSLPRSMLAVSDAIESPAISYRDPAPARRARRSGRARDVGRRRRRRGCAVAARRPVLRRQARHRVRPAVGDQRRRGEGQAAPGVRARPGSRRPRRCRRTPRTSRRPSRRWTRRPRQGSSELIAAYQLRTRRHRSPTSSTFSHTAGRRADQLAATAPRGARRRETQSITVAAQAALRDPGAQRREGSLRAVRARPACLAERTPRAEPARAVRSSTHPSNGASPPAGSPSRPSGPVTAPAVPTRRDESTKPTPCAALKQPTLSDRRRSILPIEACSRSCTQPADPALPKRCTPVLGG